MRGRGQGQGRGRGQGRGWGRGRRSARFLEPFLLLLLRQGQAHGYTLLEKLRQFGLESRNPSAVYRVLRNMEEYGYITSTWDQKEAQGPPRRVYSLTDAGHEILEIHSQDLDETRQIIEHFLSTYRSSVE